MYMVSVNIAIGVCRLLERGGEKEGLEGVKEVSGKRFRWDECLSLPIGRNNNTHQKRKQNENHGQRCTSESLLRSRLLSTIHQARTQPFTWTEVVLGLCP